MKSPIIENLRLAADCAPLWADIMNAAADEVGRLNMHLATTQDRLDKANSEISRQAIASALSSKSLADTCKILLKSANTYGHSFFKIDQHGSIEIYPIDTVSIEYKCGELCKIMTMESKK